MFTKFLRFRGITENYVEILFGRYASVKIMTRTILNRKMNPKQSFGWHTWVIEKYGSVFVEASIIICYCIIYELILLRFYFVQPL